MDMQLLVGFSLSPPHSFIRLCDYLVVTMLHKMSVFSAETILHTLEMQTDQTISVADFIKCIPESIEEQEVLLQVSAYFLVVILYIYR